jgi:RNA polymerase sigma-70 factor (ECF subfamily)
LLFKSDKPCERAAAAAPGEPASAAELLDATDEVLAQEARALNEAAWAEIYRRHVQQVYAYIYFRLGDQHVAEDLSADVFVKAIAGIGGFSYRGTPILAWLYRIAHNITVDHRSAAARRMQAQAAEAPEDVRDKRDALGELDDRSDMMRGIRELTEDQQQVVILRFYHGMSSMEVARVMDKPVGAVKALQTRAIRSLRRVLAETERELVPA